MGVCTSNIVVVHSALGADFDSELVADFDSESDFDFELVLFLFLCL